MKKKMSIMVFFSTLFLLFFFGSFMNETLVVSAKSDYFTLADREVTKPEKSSIRTTQELYIERVLENGPADKAGLQEGDQILAINHEPVIEIDEVITILDAHAPNDLLLITIEREDETHDVEVILGKNEQEKAFLGVVLAFEMTIEEITGTETVEETEITELKDMDKYEDFAEHVLEWVNRWPFHRGGRENDIPDPDVTELMPSFDSAELPEKDLLQGAIIRNVRADSQAEEAGLQENDVITTINEQPIDSLETFEQLLDAHSVNEKMELTVERRGESETLHLELAMTEESNNSTTLGLQVGFIWRVKHTEGNLPAEFDKEKILPDTFNPSFDQNLPMPPPFEPPYIVPPHFEPPSFDFKNRERPSHPTFAPPSFNDFPRPPRFP